VQNVRDARFAQFGDFRRKIIRHLDASAPKRKNHRNATKSRNKQGRRTVSRLATTSWNVSCLRSTSSTSLLCSMLYTEHFEVIFLKPRPSSPYFLFGSFGTPKLTQVLVAAQLVAERGVEDLEEHAQNLVDGGQVQFQVLQSRLICAAEKNAVLRLSCCFDGPT